MVINIQDSSYSFSGGVSLNERVQSLSGYYKYQGAENDSASVLIYCFSHPFGEDFDTIGIGYAFLHDAEEWTSFTVDMTYLNDHTPDTFNVLIFSSGTISLDQIPQGSVLLVDEITIETGLGISDKYQLIDLSVYPNPVSNILTFETNDFDKNRRLIIYDMFGRKIKEVPFEGKRTEVSVNDFSPGNYSYRVSSDEGFLKSGTFTRP
jgi:hypothetical protein